MNGEPQTEQASERTHSGTLRRLVTIVGALAAIATAVSTIVAVVLKLVGDSSLSQASERATAQSLDPEKSEDLWSMGRRAFVEGRMEVAQRLYLDAVAANPNSSMAFNSLGMVAYCSGRYAEADARFVEALQKDPSNVLAYNNRGWVAYRRGDLRRARQFNEEAKRVRGFADTERLGECLKRCPQEDTRADECAPCPITGCSSR